MMHTLLEYASQLGLVVQVHTGLQEGNGNIISNANPVHLANAFLLYPNVRFDVFHGGYPYCLELAAIAKNFPNVYVDLCWLSMISPHYSEWYLSELLDTVPSNKILGFGGDAGSVEVAYGALAVAKDVLSVALAEKVDSGALDMEQSLEIAGMLLCDNAKSMFLGGNA
jgi:predicted TIM-barrel fold metal-dependent hydrolase